MRRAVVLGLGKSGVAVARVLSSEGYSVDIFDRKDSKALRALASDVPAGVSVHLGGYGESVVDGADLVSPAPAVPWDAPELQRARGAGTEVRSEMALFLQRCRGNVIGITGTNGKSTTTALTAAIIERSGVRTHRGGNIGETVLDRAADIHEGDWIVLELSSFQIESLESVECEIGCVLNVTPDHLDRHGTFENYAAIKARLVEGARRSAVLNHDDVTTRAMADRVSAPVLFFGDDLEGHDGASVIGQSVVSVESGRVEAFLAVDDIPLFGAHNVANVLAATAMARTAGVELDVIAAAVRDFRPVPHRLQTVRDEDGVLWINDSKATNVDSAVKALNSFADRTIVWIGGGSSKGVGPDALADEVARRARVAIACGATGPELAAALAQRGVDHFLETDLTAAVIRARRVANAGDVVLLAPGYASFDQFANFEERGDTFAALVNRT